MSCSHWDQSVYVITVTDVRVHNSVLPVTILRPKLVVVTSGMCVHSDSSIGYNKLCEYSCCSDENKTINHELLRRVLTVL